MKYFVSYSHPEKHFIDFKLIINTKPDRKQSKQCALVEDVSFLNVQLEIQFKFKPTAYFKEGIDRWNVEDYLYEVGERIGQIIIMPYPQIEFEEVDTLDDSVRGTGGFGSTNKK